MSALLFEFRRDDAELETALRQAFGDRLEEVEVDRFEGAVGLIQLIVPVTGLVLPALVKILMTYFETRSKERLGRKVTLNGRVMRFEGLSADDIAKLIAAEAKKS